MQEQRRFGSRAQGSNMNHTRPVRILIGDEHPILREGLRTLLDATRGFQVVAEARDPAEVIELTRELKPDVLLLGLPMPGLPGLDAVRELTASCGSARTILLAAGLEDQEIVDALQLGARGVVLKESANDALLLKSIRCVTSDGIWAGGKRLPDDSESRKRIQEPSR
jgi:DNA-binding NarL/FixJ family response regulator